MSIDGVSFIIPAYNEEDNIAACILAIQREILRRPDVETEIIVVDNASTDNTASIARSLGVKVVREDRKGIVWARQRGAMAAKFEFLANIDADNRLGHGWLDVALRAMTPDTACISGPVEYDNVPWHVTMGTRGFYYVARFLNWLGGYTVQGGNYVLRKSVFERMGGYDLQFEFYGEDTRTGHLAAQYGRVKLVPELWIHSSPRRLLNQGALSMTWKYITAYFYVWLFDRPITKKYEDYR